MCFIEIFQFQLPIHFKEKKTTKVKKKNKKQTYPRLRASLYKLKALNWSAFHCRKNYSRVVELCYTLTGHFEEKLVELRTERPLAQQQLKAFSTARTLLHSFTLLKFSPQCH